MIDRKNHAYMLYVEQGMTAKNAAEIIGVSQNTFSKWARQGHWKEQRDRRTVAPARLATMYYDLSQQIVDSLYDQGLKPHGQDADILNKLATAAKKLEEQYDHTHDYKVLSDFNLYLNQVAPELLPVIFQHEKNFMSKRFKSELNRYGELLMSKDPILPANNTSKIQADTTKIQLKSN